MRRRPDPAEMARPVFAPTEKPKPFRLGRVTYPAVVDQEGIIRLVENSPACCPHCAETLPPGPARVDVLVRYLGWVWRDGRTIHRGEGERDEQVDTTLPDRGIAGRELGPDRPEP